MLIVLYLVTALLLLGTAIPFLPIAHGVVRVCDFPRLQIAGLALVLIPVALWLRSSDPSSILLAVTLAAIAAVQIAQCVRFTRLWRVQSLDYEGSADDPGVFRILSANVKMSNRDYGPMLDLVRERDPDIAVFMEVDDGWLRALRSLEHRMPHVVARAQENAYGIALFSRLPLSKSEVRFLLLDDVPSIRTAVTLPDGHSFRLYAMHPEPPVPYEDTLGRDGEIILAARELKQDSLPVVVTGDLNDVAWSRTTRRFQRLAGLLDPRVGRGFFNSFDARYWFLRWPLDHLFHDPHFRLVCLERCRYVGSDHFPMLFELALTAEPAAKLHPDKPDRTDVEEAEDVVREAAKLDREAIGSDWEK